MKNKKIFSAVILSLLIIATALSINNFVTEAHTNVFPPGSTYKKEWARVDSLTDKGLTKSALEVIENIYKKAKTENNPPQLVKSVIYRIKLQSDMEEEANVKAIYQLSADAATSSFPAKPVLHSLLAETYWRYYQNNRWKINGRTETVNFKNDDIRTWDMKTIVKQVIKEYQASLQNREALKQTALGIYDPILILSKQNDSRKLRPTLYDFLAQRAVDFYMNEEPDIIKPAEHFELDRPGYFGDFTFFVNQNITTKDSLSLKFYALKIMQDLIAFHAQDKDPDALVDVDLKRLKFVRSHSTLEQKDSLYLLSLQKLEAQFTSSPVSSEVSYEIANEYFSNGNKYKPLQSEDFKWAKKKSLDICQQAIERFPNSYGVGNCKSLLARIQEKVMSFNCEKINSANLPFRANLKFKNIKKVYLCIARLEADDNNKQQNNNTNETLFKNYLKLNPLKSWGVELPNDGDCQDHAVEIKIDALPFGNYVILCGTDKEFSYQKNEVAFATCWSSNLSYVSRKSAKTGANDFYVMDREKGFLLPNVSAQVWYTQYNYSFRVYESTKGERYISDEHGFFSVPGIGSNRNFKIDFSLDEDRLQTESNFNETNYRPSDKRKSLKTFFFTDRLIYRPGQTVYFKGITIETDGETNEIKPGLNTLVQFFDANGQKVSNVDLLSNEYGSFNGSFTAPSSGLNGRMYITNGNGTVYFSVEDYKRPKFEVKLQPIKGSYRLGEEVKAEGVAKSYAGSNIDNAQVKYRVVRNANFPYWGYYWRGYLPTSTQLEIINGTTTSNDTGGFTIRFKAIPDLSVSKTFSPTYSYTIYADVTDINGETHSTQRIVMAGYKALNLNVDLPEMVNKETPQQVKIHSTNMSGEEENSVGQIVIYQLKEPDRTFRKRLWERPDKFIMTKEAFYAAFPNDPYADENNKYKWEKGTKVLEVAYDTQKDKEFALNKLSEWPQGSYVMEAKTKDKFGAEVKDIKYFTLYSVQQKTTPVNTDDWFSVITDKGEPGEKAQVLIGTRGTNVPVLYEIESKGSIIKREWITLNKEQQLIEIPIEERFRGNFAVHFVMIHHNRAYQHDNVITVPWTNKQLNLEFETFRDKLNPGQQEEWKVKIKDKQGDKLAAEMLATLYDASLDAFTPNNWSFNIYNTYSAQLNWNSSMGFGMNNASTLGYAWNTYSSFTTREYDQLNNFGLGYDYSNRSYKSKSNARSMGEPSMVMVSKQSSAVEGQTADKEVTLSANANNTDLAQATVPDQKTQTEDLSKLSTRSNFNETAFFYPNLETNEKGEVIMKFTIPESLTRWKMMGFAHTKDLKYGQIVKELQTQKDLMILSNPPRFLRESDLISFSSKVSNLSDKDLSGTAQLMLFDALSLKPIDDLLGNKNASIPFTVKKGESFPLSWDLKIPIGIGAVTYKVVAKAGNYTDGEEMVLPVLTNRMLVTESMPLPIRGKETKTFRFDKLISQSNGSSTLRNYKLTLEFTANPAWYAVQALPYLMEYPYDCSEQVFSRFYANSIASHIANSSPKIKAVFDSWKNTDPNALLSNLEKNQELKSLLLEESPWVLNAKDETERKKRVALLFDLNKMSDEMGRSLVKLQKTQSPNGGWSWFEGMPDDRYITQYIITGMGHLDHLAVKDIRSNNTIWNMCTKGVRYLDNRIREDYEWILSHDANHINDNHLSYLQIQYLYARSYFKDIPIDNNNQKAFDYYKEQAQKYWLQNSHYMQGMIALALNRYEVKTVPMDIMKSLKENSLSSEEMGMYWKENYEGFYWYQAPIESQALLIEAFDEVANDKKSVDDLKIWLLKSKQTQDWKTTKATAEAVYALLLRGTDWLATESNVEVSLGDVKIDPKQLPDVKVEAGTGYFKTSWSDGDIKPEMGNVTVHKTDEGVSWGALYWQYFEQLDKITPHDTPLKLNKKLFLEKNSAAGPVLEAISESTALKPGDKLKVRIELRVDRSMEYVQMKDMRASGLEPTNVLSTYKYQDGLGYYESTRDASTNFFFSYLPKGTYIFEYPLVVTHKGDFSNGITSIQCMYAPEFASHSEGIRIKVGN